MARGLEIDGKRVDDESDCYVIAEIGHNHQGSVELAKKLFDSAKECGADAVKLQKRNNRSLFTKEMFGQTYNSHSAFAPTYGEHREALELGHDEYVELQGYAKELGLTMFSTPFDIQSADFLEELEMPLYKIASGDLKNLPLIKHVASFGKPVIVSTGGGTIDDVLRVYEEVMPINEQFCILQCTAGYPPKWEELNLRVIESFRQDFPEATIGLSSHDNGIAMSVVAYVLGARVIEKHFTLDRTMKGSDHAFSLAPPGMRRMVRDLRRTRLALGSGAKSVYESELAPMHKMGKKLVAARALPEGHVLTEEDIAIKSPGDGLPPYEMGAILGRKALRPIAEDENLLFENLSE